MFAFLSTVFDIVFSNNEVVWSCQDSLYGVVGIVSRSWIRVRDLDRQCHDFPSFTFDLTFALDLIVTYFITLVIVYNDLGFVLLILYFHYSSPRMQE